MKTYADHYIRDFFVNKPGRPRKATAKTGSEPQREYRNRQKSSSVTSDEKRLCAWCGSERSNLCGLCRVGQLGNI